MSQVQTLQVTPITDAKNRIVILEPDKDAIAATDTESESPVFFLPAGAETNAFGDQSYVSAGEYAPYRQALGFKYIDVVLAGEKEFISQSARLEAIKPATFSGHRIATYVCRTGSDYAQAFVISRYLMKGQDAPIELGCYKLQGIKIISVDKVEIENKGTVNGNEIKYLVFNGDMTVSVPEHTQGGTLSEVFVVDENGKDLTVEINAAAGIVSVFSIDENGAKKPAAGYGSCRLDISYKASRFKINYDAEDFRIKVKDAGGGAFMLENNASSLYPAMFKAKAAIHKGGKSIDLVEIYTLKKKVYIVEFKPAPANPIDKNLTETSRVQIDRELISEDGSIFRVGVIGSMKMTDAFGNEWSLSFDEE